MPARSGADTVTIVGAGPAGFALGMSLGLFLAITFAFCVAFDLVFPDFAMNRVSAPLLPGFTWLSWSSIFIGLAESFAYGWYVTLTLGPLCNLFAARFGKIVRL